MRRWSRLGSQVVLRDRWLHVTADRCEIAPGKTVEPFYVIHESEWVQVFAINERAEVLTVRQYRYAADVVCLELPGGVVDPGEDPEAAAKRELLEETGHVATHWSYVGKHFANPARQTNAIHMFLAEGLREAASQRLDETEEIVWSYLSRAELDQAVLEGSFSQALHVATLYRVGQFLRARSNA